MENTREVSGVFIGRLGDLGLGNVDGIPSEYADLDADTLHKLAEQTARELVEPTDSRRLACIDGRSSLRNADGSPAEVRLRRVGGSAANYGVALNAEAPVADSLNPDLPLGDQIQIVDDFVGERSAHQGGCGGANGEVTDHELIANNPEILEATKTLMNVPEVKEYLECEYDETLGRRVQENAKTTASLLRTKGWDGQKYVEGVQSQNPGGVETLEVDPSDHAFHGHKEPTVTIVIGDKTAPLTHNGFVWNLKATKEVAKKIGSPRGTQGYQQAVIADIAKHMAVCKRLPSDKTPVLLVAA